VSSVFISKAISWGLLSQRPQWSLRVSWAALRISFEKDKQLSTSTTICNVLHNVTCTTWHAQRCIANFKPRSFLRAYQLRPLHRGAVQLIPGQTKVWSRIPSVQLRHKKLQTFTSSLILKPVKASRDVRSAGFGRAQQFFHSQRAKTSIQSILYSQRTHSKKTQVSSPSSAGCCSGKGILAWEGHNSTTLPQWSGEFFVDLQCSNLHELWSLQCTLRQVQILAIYIWGYEKSTSLSFQPFPSFPDRNLKPDTATPPAFADWGASTSIHSAKNSGGLCEGW